MIGLEPPSNQTDKCSPCTGCTHKFYAIEGNMQFMGESYQVCEPGDLPLDLRCGWNDASTGDIRSGSPTKTLIKIPGKLFVKPT